jgi:holliday junction DNA helicase RuvA
MIASLTVKIDRIEGNMAFVSLPAATELPGLAPLAPASGIAHTSNMTFEVLLPAFLARRLLTRVGETVWLRTTLYLEGEGQGTSFVPRIIGFSSDSELAFFDLFTTVKGIGRKKALRALAEPPSVVAGAIMRADAKGLSNLPEIGKRMAETIIAELKGKVDRFAGTDVLDPGSSKPITKPVPVTDGPDLAPEAIDAVSALIALGEHRTEATRKVQLVLAKNPQSKLGTSQLVSAALGTR